MSTVQEQVDALGVWYHNIYLGDGIWTMGVEHGPPRAGNCEKIKAAIPADLAGKRVLDIGCNAGYFSFVCRERGAEVVGVDYRKEYIEQARFCADIKKLDVEFHVASVYDIEQFGKFDLVLCLGLIYHLADVRRAFRAIGAVCSDVIILETVAFVEHWESVLPMMLLSERLHEKSGKSLFNRAAIETLLQETRFTAIRSIFETGRVCYTARKAK